MLIHQQEELNVVERNACNCFCPKWKLISCATMAKVLQITTWVLVCSLPWLQCKRWIPIGSMGCVHAHGRKLTIEGWGSPSHVQSVVEKNKEKNWKVVKIGQAINQTPTPWPKHDKFWARWALDILSKSMFKKVWWCKCFNMKILNWTICCLMSCSNGGRHAWAKGGKRSHATLKCCWKGNVLLLTGAKVSRRKGPWSNINLVVMIEMTKAQFFK